MIMVISVVIVIIIIIIVPAKERRAHSIGFGKAFEGCVVPVSSGDRGQIIRGTSTGWLKRGRDAV